MNTADLINVFEDTQDTIRNNDFLSITTQESREKNKMYDSAFSALVRKTKNPELNVRIIEGSSFDTVRTFTKGRVAVLNFANPHEPGGGVKRGARAQEECLCRCSNLYNVLATKELSQFYYQWHKQNTNYLFSDRVIYSQNIQIIKSDDYQLLDSPVAVDVITCAAPYNVYGFDRELLKSTYESRITNILEVAIDNDVDTIVLGAFGCGAFHNPPELMAEAFKEILINRGYYKFFENVVFAIINANRFDRNFAVFQETLSM